MERLSALKILKTDNKIECTLGIFQRFEFDLEEIHQRHNTDMFIGIDPGSRHMGFTLLYRTGKGDAYECWLPAQPNALARMHAVRRMLEWILDCHFKGYQVMPNIHAVVEGSGYSKVFGQPELAEARAMSILTLDKYGIKVEVIVPNLVRKVAFGSAKIKADELWKGLISPNAASSIGCAICASKL